MAIISGTVTFTAAELAALAKQVAPLIPVGTTPPVVIPPVVTPPAAGVFWLYHNGVSSTGKLDYDYGSGSVTYDVADPLVAGGKCILIAGDEGFQPRMPNDNFNSAGFNFLLISILPTQAGYSGTVGAEKIGDQPIPGATGMINFMKYGPNPPVVGQWNDYVVPLSALSIPPGGTNFYKLGILDQGQEASKSTNKVYVKNFGFSP
jgi:hypothetical protein